MKKKFSTPLFFFTLVFSSLFFSSCDPAPRDRRNQQDLNQRKQISDSFQGQDNWGYYNGPIENTPKTSPQGPCDLSSSAYYYNSTALGKYNTCLQGTTFSLQLERNFDSLCVFSVSHLKTGNIPVINNPNSTTLCHKIEAGKIYQFNFQSASTHFLVLQDTKTTDNHQLAQLFTSCTDTTNTQDNCAKAIAQSNYFFIHKQQ